MDLQEFAPELSEVFAFVAATATAIRMHSAYNSQADLSKIESAMDVRWLSDALHNFDQFGAALANNNAAHLAAACEAHIAVFRQHLTVMRHPYSPGASFQRSAVHFRRRQLELPDFIAILERLRAKALAQAARRRTDGETCASAPNQL